MQNKLKHFILAVLLPLWGVGGFAQIYPVTISTQLTQPSPIYLSDYANTTNINSPIKVQLTLNDLTIMNRQVRLKCYFQGSVSFVTNDFVVGASPIYLEGGVPTLLTNVDLGPYFEFQNLQGINPNQYAQPLPEGIYTISFEVYDFATNKKLSKKSSVTTVIFQNEPPILNLPVNKAGIVEQNIQNIFFSWTPRSINVSNVEYEFSLVEIWNTNAPIQNAFSYSPPLYTTTTRNTSVQYSIAEPQLIPGKTYAWRVKAKALIGAEEIGVFKNNGYSEIFSFKYLTLCNAPKAVTATNVSQDQAKITWSGEVDNLDYQVNYREKNADSKWYSSVTPREYITISNLKPNTAYEYTVGASCDPGEYSLSNIQEFTTMAQDEIAFKGCGIKPDPAALANQTPLPTLFPNDVVTAGDFPIVVLKSTGSNGTFSGEGYVTLPFLEKFKELIDAADALGGEKVNIGKYSRIRITFNNIGVNTDFQLISGEIIAAYDPNWGSMVDADKLVNDVMGDTGAVIPIDVQFEIKSVVKNADGTLTITGTNGAVLVKPKTDNDLIITDKNGIQYAVSPDAPIGEIKQSGKAAPGGVPTPQNTNGMGSGGNIKEISSADVTITFVAGSGFYSLDENPNQDPNLKANTKLNSTYDVIPKKDGSSYYVNYKAISDAPNDVDSVTANATFSNGKTTEDIVFKTENGTEIESSWSGNVATLKLKRTLDFAKESILATVRPPAQKDSVKVTTKYDIAGALNMWHLASKKVKVTLVGLNGGKTPTQSDAQKYLNSIYGKAGIQFEVNTTTADIEESWGVSIETGDSDLLNTYTDGQLKINSNFLAQLGSNYKNDTYYVFFTKVPASKQGTLGFMPLKRQFGYVFAPATEADGLRTLAHELGHGIFGLQHPFTNYKTTTTTDLLMDYGTGTALSHNDWEIMHAPGLQLYQFTQGSSAGELAGGFGLSPNWEFIQTQLSSVYTGSYIAGDGFTSGFSDIFNKQPVKYVWEPISQKYIYTYTENGTEKKDVHKIITEVSDNNWFWLFANNKGQCNVDKIYIRTKYKYIKTFKASRDEVGLQRYIQTIIADKTKKEGDKDSRDQVWGILNCASDEEGNGNNADYKNYVVNLGKTANKKYTEDKTDVGTQTSHVFDLATVINPEEKQKILNQLGGINKNTGILCKIYLIDANTPTEKRNEITDYLGTLKGKEIGLLIDFTDAKNPAINTFLGDGIEGKGTPSMNKYLQYLADVLPNFEGTYTPFNPLTAMLDGLAGVIGQAKIPIRFYNPDEKDYNPIPGQVYSLLTFTVIKDKINNFVLNNNEYIAKYSESRCSFAFTCGIWNGLVTAIGGVPEGASMVIKLITNEDDQTVKLWNGLSKLSWSTIGDMAGEQWNKYSANPCMASYATGEVGFVVISCFYGAGEAKGISAFFQTLDKLDVIGQAIGKFAKLTSPFFKAGLNKFGKFVITPLAKLEPTISKELREVLASNFKRILKKTDQISISLHATDQGKFLVDGVEFSPEELGELLTKKLGNKKEIILLSCNDLASAKALSEATGKVVYTTEGTLTVFENGIQRAEGTDWYKVEPNGNATKVDPPVNECTNCTGNGVEMGTKVDKEAVQLAINDLLNEFDDVFINKLKNIPGYESLMNQMGQTWKKYHAGKFILTHIKENNLVDLIESFETKIDDALGDFTADVKFKPNAENPLGKFAEYKSWKKGSFSLLNGDQFLKQFKNYVKSGKFEYIFDKDKLLKQGITDADKFVKEQFQSVFKKNSGLIYDVNENFAKRFKLPNGNLVKNKNEFLQLVETEDFWKQLNFIKVE